MTMQSMLIDAHKSSVESRDRLLASVDKAYNDRVSWLSDQSKAALTEIQRQYSEVRQAIIDEFGSDSAETDQPAAIAVVPQADPEPEDRPHPIEQPIAPAATPA